MNPNDESFKQFKTVYIDFCFWTNCNPNFYRCYFGDNSDYSCIELYNSDKNVGNSFYEIGNNSDILSISYDYVSNALSFCN